MPGTQMRLRPADTHAYLFVPVIRINDSRHRRGSLSSAARGQFADSPRAHGAACPTRRWTAPARFAVTASSAPRSRSSGPRWRCGSYAPSKSSSGPQALDSPTSPPTGGRPATWSVSRSWRSCCRPRPADRLSRRLAPRDPHGRALAHPPGDSWAVSLTTRLPSHPNRGASTRAAARRAPRDRSARAPAAPNPSDTKRGHATGGAPQTGAGGASDGAAVDAASDETVGRHLDTESDETGGPRLDTEDLECADLDDGGWADYDNAGKRVVPVLRVSTSLDALRDGLQRAGITDSGESLSAATVRRLACDAEIIPTAAQWQGSCHRCGATHPARQ